MNNPPVPNHPLDGPTTLRPDALRARDFAGLCHPPQVGASRVTGARWQGLAHPFAAWQ